MRHAAAVLLVIMVAACLPTAVQGCGCGIDEALVDRALGSDRIAADVAVAALRAEGQLAITFLGHEHTRRAKDPTLDEAAWDALYDRVGQQRGCRTSGLFWYTDLAEAERVAAALRRPILSLRLLGRLTDEYSCANSRFFRAILYSNREVADYLRANVVLHWESERPVPLVTIDFGDGRQIRTTITGNSVHRVLDAQGRPVDALPGLYGPAPFLEHLREAVALERSLRALPEQAADGVETRATFLANHHAVELAKLEAAWSLIDGVDGPLPLLPGEIPGQADGAPAAAAAERLTVSKGIAERPMLKAADLGMDEDATEGSDPLPRAVRARLARLSPGLGTIDAASREVIARQLGAGSGVPLTIVGEAQLALAVRAIEATVAEDTVFDELVLHAAIHRRFAAGTQGGRVELDRWMYDRLFLTPASDPWLGLLPRAYAAIDHNGVVAAAARR